MKPLYLTIALMLLTVHPVAAHPLPMSAVALDFEREDIGAEVILPTQDFEFAFGKPMLDAPNTIVSRYEPDLRSYLLAHIHPVAPDGRPWSVAVDKIWEDTSQYPPDICAHLTFRPAPGAPLRHFILNYDAIAREIANHRALVFVRNDWNAAQFRDRSQIPPAEEAVGMIRFLVHSVEIDRTSGSFWQGFGVVFKLGVEHIAAGLDHLLFLFVLLLPVPLVTGTKRWGAFRGTKSSFVQLLKIVTAFTLGHSLTLLVGALGWVRLPQRPIEILIALTILISAIHAIRPIFAGWEPWIAAGFGLVHGLAFSTTVASFGFSPWHLAMTILAFNLGIEAMQLIFVFTSVPVLILLSRSGCYTVARVTGAALAGLAALLWIALAPAA